MQFSDFKVSERVFTGAMGWYLRSYYTAKKLRFQRAVIGNADKSSITQFFNCAKPNLGFVTALWLFHTQKILFHVENKKLLHLERFCGGKSNLAGREKSITLHKKKLAACISVTFDF